MHIGLIGQHYDNPKNEKYYITHSYFLYPISKTMLYAYLQEQNKIHIYFPPNPFFNWLDVCHCKVCHIFLGLNTEERQSPTMTQGMVWDLQIIMPIHSETWMPGSCTYKILTASNVLF